MTQKNAIAFALSAFAMNSPVTVRYQPDGVVCVSGAPRQDFAGLWIQGSPRFDFSCSTRSQVKYIDSAVRKGLFSN